MSTHGVPSRSCSPTSAPPSEEFDLWPTAFSTEAFSPAKECERNTRCPSPSRSPTPAELRRSTDPAARSRRRPDRCGKTDRSMDIARATGSRIVVLDRVQCRREIAIGSGRPEPMSGVDRVFLADRAVADGVISPEAGYDSLARLLAGNEPTVVEGGSVSLLNLLAGDARWRENAEIAGEYVRHGRDFRHRVHERVDGMLRPGRAERTMLDEIRDLWPDPRTHAVLAGVVGYREIIAHAGDDHGFRFTGAALGRLVDAVTTAHLAYAAIQIGELDTVLRPFRGA
ncbi:isopentenyl transferase family protein [Streptomyces sp. NPDC001514]